MSFTVGVFLLIASVLVGGMVVTLLHKLNKDRLIKVLLSLSGGFLIALAFTHFIPEIYANNWEHAGYFILFGFLIQLLLEYFSGGIEHGHIHTNNKSGTLSWTLFIALSFHSLIEGIPLDSFFLHGSVQEVSVHAHHSHYGGSLDGLLFGIILHKIPVAVALMTLLIASGFKQVKAWLILGAFSLMAPIGMLIGHFGALNTWCDVEVVLAIVVGMFLHISTTIIFESSENHRLNIVKLISLMAGVGLALLFVG